MGKAIQRLYEKHLIGDRYLLVTEIYEIIGKCYYDDNLRFSLLFIDTVTRRKILIGNHYPKGPHLHIDDIEMAYEYSGIDSLINDFKSLVLNIHGVAI